MMTPITVNSFIDVIKFAAVVIAFLHFLFVVAMFRQIITINSKIKTSRGGCLRLITLVHILVLSGIILIIVFI
jgi:hypothetical protein